MDVGKVLTAWVYQGRMDVVMEIDDSKNVEVLPDSQYLI